jgi:hypothetical protein
MKPEMKNIDASTDDAADDWEERRLCSDGNCIGVIGPDGRCKECGRPDGPGSGVAEPAVPPPLAAEPAEKAPAAEACGRSDNDWEGRCLCSDGNCIGVIGPDGRCRECGQPYAD